MMFRLLFVCTFVLISACSSDGGERPEYLDSFSVKGLEIPPRLTSPDTSKELRLPRPSEKAFKELKDRESFSMQGNVAPVFEGLELKSSGNVHWLEVKQDADSLWSVLEDFWGHEGIKIERNEPLLGFMETEWVKEFDPRRDVSFFARMINKLSPDRMDKFRLRVEREPDRKISRIFISHRGLEIVVGDDTTGWRTRASDADLEHEMLYRLVLFSGIGKARADEMFAAYVPYQSRIRALEGDNLYEVSGSPDYVWNRVIHALDRIGVDISQQDKPRGGIDVVVNNVPQKLVARDDDLDESSWLVRLFTGGPGDEELEEGKVTVHLNLQPGNHSTHLQLTHAGEALPHIGLAARFEEALINLLR